MVQHCFTNSSLYLHKVEFACYVIREKGAKLKNRKWHKVKSDLRLFWSIYVSLFMCAIFNRENLVNFLFFSLSGTFGKSIWRHQLDSFPSCTKPPVWQPKTSQNHPHESLNFDSESEDDNSKDRTFPDVDNGHCIYRQAAENFRTPTFHSFELDT
uniref:Uncharacterized protein n=1 Tax=Varanus komodoensis TaxID=61221 RepID=A0A8D2LFL4_VARKO